MNEPTRSADTDLADAVRRAAQDGQRSVVWRRGDTAAVVPVADLQALEEYERLDDGYDSQEAREALAEGPDGSGTPGNRARRPGRIGARPEQEQEQEQEQELPETRRRGMARPSADRRDDAQASPLRMYFARGTAHTGRATVLEKRASR